MEQNDAPAVVQAADAGAAPETLGQALGADQARQQLEHLPDPLGELPVLTSVQMGTCTEVHDAPHHLAKFELGLPEGPVPVYYWPTAPAVGSVWPIRQASQHLRRWTRTEVPQGVWLYYLDVLGTLRRVPWPPPAAGWPVHVEPIATDVPLGDAVWSPNLTEETADPFPPTQYGVRSQLGADATTGDVYYCAIRNATVLDTGGFAQGVEVVRITPAGGVTSTRLPTIASDGWPLAYTVAGMDPGATGPPVIGLVAEWGNASLAGFPPGSRGQPYVGVARVDVVTIQPPASSSPDAPVCRLVEAGRLSPWQGDGTVPGGPDSLAPVTDIQAVTAHGSAWTATAPGPGWVAGDVVIAMAGQATQMPAVIRQAGADPHYYPLPNWTEPPGPFGLPRVWLIVNGHPPAPLVLPPPPSVDGVGAGVQTGAPIWTTPGPGDGVQVLATFTPLKILRPDRPEIPVPSYPPTDAPDTLYRYRGSGWTALAASVAVAVGGDGQDIIARAHEYHTPPWHAAGTWVYSTDGGDHWAPLPQPPGLPARQWDTPGGAGRTLTPPVLAFLHVPG